MENETSDFDRWLRRVEASTDGLDVANALEAVARLARDAFGARLWFAEILGKRWSHIAGPGTVAPAESEICQIAINDKLGLVSDTWGRLSDQRDRATFVAFLRQLVGSKAAGAQDRATAALRLSR